MENIVLATSCFRQNQADLIALANVNRSIQAGTMQARCLIGAIRLFFDKTVVIVVQFNEVSFLVITCSD